MRERERLRTVENVEVICYSLQVSVKCPVPYQCHYVESFGYGYVRHMQVSEHHKVLELVSVEGRKETAWIWDSLVLSLSKWRLAPAMAVLAFEAF